MTIPEPVSPAPALLIRPDGELVAVHIPSGWVVWRTDSPRVQAVRVGAEEVTGWLRLAPVSPAPEDTVTHVVMDASDNPECIDDCPGCVPAVSSAPDTEALRQQAAKTADAARVDAIRNGTLEDAANAVFEALGGYPGPEIVTFHQALAAVRTRSAEWERRGEDLLAAGHTIAGLRADLDRARAERDKLGREVARLRAELAGARTIPDDAAERLADKLRGFGLVDPDDDTMPVFKDVDDDGYRIGAIDHWTGAVGIAEELAKYVRSWLSAPTTDPAPAAADDEVPADVVRRIKAEALLEARDAARAARRLCWAENREQEVIRHWGGMAGWLATRAKAIAAGEEPDWPDAAYVSAPAAPQAPAEPTAPYAECNGSGVVPDWDAPTEQWLHVPPAPTERNTQR